METEGCLPQEVIQIVQPDTVVLPCQEEASPQVQWEHSRVGGKQRLKWCVLAVLVFPAGTHSHVRAGIVVVVVGLMLSDFSG